MELTVTTKRENPLLDRTEVYFRVAHPGAGTPTRAEIKKALAGALNANGVVVLDWARSEFGATSTRGYAKVYRSKEKALELETPPILIRNGLLAARKKEAAPGEGAPTPPKKEEKAEAPAKEAPKPAAKEEKKAEAPKEKKPAGKKEGK